MWKTVSEDCNLACDYCYYSRVGGTIGPKVNRIESSLLEKFIREYMDFCQGQASFAWQGGEPLLAGLDFFKEVVSLQAKFSKPNTVISNSLQTNATLVNQEWAAFFKQYNFFIGVSLDGPKDVHDARRVTRAGVGSFDRVMRGIDILREAHVDFNILTVIHEGNVHRAPELMTFYEKESFRFVQFIPAMDFRAQETSKQARYLINDHEYGDFLCSVFDVWYNEGEPNTSVRFFDNMLAVYLHQEAELCIHRKACPTTLILEQNGDAFPCDFYISEEYKVGNVGVDSLTDILGHLVYKKFLSMKPTLPEKCVSCEFVRLCHGGCPRNRTWNDTGQDVDVDYFCESYLQVYRYAHGRMSSLAERVRLNWLRQYIGSGRTLPARNEACFCGSGIKYKKCCEPLLNQLGRSRTAP